MPYPTDVTEPRYGVDAFSENDRAAQLAQAAFLLLLGKELRRRRGALKAATETPVHEDEARFGIPPIPTEARRYRSEDLVPERAIEAIAPRQRARRMYERSRDLAQQLEKQPREATAAELMSVCMTRAEPIVQVAAAAAAFEITAEPRRVIAVLAKATLDNDVLVRDLAATALARINPEHAALRRLTSRPRPRRRKGTAHTSLLVHGTFARTQTWWQPGGKFHKYLLNEVLPDLYAKPDRFEWTGGYSDAARVIAASDLVTWAGDHALTEALLMGHSHGSNVIFIATTMGLAMREAVVLSCPVRWPQYMPDFSQIDKTVSVRVHLDLVILADGGGQEFDDPRVQENVLPVWFNHSATHDPAIWRKYDVPAML
jgi:hypothetical protein